MKPIMTRREMLKVSLATAAGVSLGNRLGLGQLSQLYAATNPLNPMPTRKLGKTGFEVPLFSLGGQSTIEQPGKQDEAVAIIHRALDYGVKFIDTASIYGRGISETYIGEVMKERRDEVFLATKSRDYTYDGTMRVIEESLRRLQTDWIDLYQHHNVSSGDGLRQVLGPNGALKAFNELHEQGVIRHKGITGHSSRVLLDAIRTVDYDCVLITLNPANMSMRDGEHMTEFMTAAVEKEIGIIGMKVVGRGNLLRRGVTMEQAMRYTLSYPVSTVIIGITEIAQIEENTRIAQAFEPLSESQMMQLEQVARV